MPPTHPRSHLEVERAEEAALLNFEIHLCQPQLVRHAYDGIAFIQTKAEILRETVNHHADVGRALTDGDPVDCIQRIVKKVWVDLRLQRRQLGFPFANLGCVVFFDERTHTQDQVVDASLQHMEVTINRR